MIRSGLECLKVVIQTLLRMIIDIRIHQTRGNYLQAMGNRVLNREGNSVAKNLLVKNYFAEGCS